MSTIYGCAKRVCIWLGEGDESSRIAFGFIKDEVLQLQNFDELCESREASKKWSALLDLMQREWFSRRWVVQEIALAQDAEIYCGTDRLPWKDFAVAVELFVEVETATHRLSEVMKKDPQFYHVPGWFEYVSALGASLLVEATGKLFRHATKTPAGTNGPKFPATTNGNANVANTHTEQVQIDEQAREQERRQPLLSLEYLVSSLSVFEASVEHDAIYALLAISKDTIPSAGDPETDILVDRTQSTLEMFTQRKRYRVRYDQYYVDVCKDFVEFCIQQAPDPSRALDIICRPWAPEDKKGIRVRGEAVGSKVTEDVPLPSWIPQLSGAPYAMFRHAGVHTLKLGRVNADPLVGLPSVLQRNYKAAESKAIDKRAISFRKRISEQSRKHYSMFVKGFILDTVKEVFPASQSGAIPQEWIFACGWKNAPDSEPPEEFWRTIVADRGRDGRNPPVYYSRACKESFDKGGLLSGAVSTTDLINNERCSVVAQFCRRVQSVIWNRSLIRTGSGRLGLARKDIREGDHVCILYGCSVPVVLRRSKRKDDDVVQSEKLEDFYNLIIKFQLKWKSRFKRVKKLRHWRWLFRAWKAAKDPGLLMMIYGLRWKRIVQAKKQQRWASSIEEWRATIKTKYPEHAADNSPTTPNAHGPEPTGGATMLSSPTALAICPSGMCAIMRSLENEEKRGRPADFIYYYSTFFGEAYIHGMMDGEAMAVQNDEGKPAEVFELR